MISLQTNLFICKHNTQTLSISVPKSSATQLMPRKKNRDRAVYWMRHVRVRDEERVREVVTFNLVGADRKAAIAAMYQDIETELSSTPEYQLAKAAGHDTYFRWEWKRRGSHDYWEIILGSRNNIVLLNPKSYMPSPFIDDD
jgi:hypothetical protein